MDNYYDNIFDSIPPQPTQLNENTKSSSNECKHAKTIEEDGLNICIQCGQEIDRRIIHDKEWRYYNGSRMSDPNRAHARKTQDKNIQRDVVNMNFSDNVIDIAEELYIEVTNGKIFRGGSRKSIVFACIYHAYKILEIPKTPENLIPIFNITKKDGLKGLKMVNINISKNSKVHSTQLTLPNIIRDMMKEITSKQEHVDEVIKLSELTLNRSSKINRARPQSVAASLIYLWIMKNNINITMDDLTSITNLSHLTITKNTKELERILSQPNK